MDPAPLHPRLAAALARLDARIDWERRDRGAMRQDLAPMRDLCERLGRPQERFRAVHVAGSKGKGSTAALVAAGLSRAGLRVGLYASPHVARVTERVTLAGAPVPDELLAEGLELALAALEHAERDGGAAAAATWFDLMTAAAFVAFARHGVDWAVVEVGLGGRLDSTNVVRGEVAVITTIELEHAELLGPTRAAIAREKAGILKPGATLVSGPPAGDEAGDAIRERAAALGVPVVDPAPAEGIAGKNRALAEAALTALGARGVQDAQGRPLGAHHLDAQAVLAARLPGRLERRFLGEVPVVLDGAHTPGSVAAVLDELAQGPGRLGPPQVVLSLTRDKDAAGVLKVLAGRVDRVHCTSVGTVRHRSAEELRDLAVAAGLVAMAVEPPYVAVVTAAAEAREGGWVLVIGSLYLVGAVGGEWKKGRPEEPACSPSAPTSS